MTEAMMRSVSASGSKEETEASQRLANLMNATQSKIKAVKANLEKMKATTSELTGQKKLQVQEQRIRENLHKSLVGKFMSAVETYKNAQKRYQTELTGKVKRQVTIVVPDATDEFVDNVMAQEGGVQKLYEEVIMKSAATEVKAAYESAMEQFDEVKRLEQSVAEMTQMFVDMALLVEAQGEILDNIEEHVLNAKELTDAGNTDLEASISYQKSIRKKQCCVILIVLVIGGAIVGGLILV